MKRIHLILASYLIVGLIGTTEIFANTIGPKAVTPTDISRGTIFVSPAGSGTACSAASPCNIRSAISKAVSGDVVFLRDGVYPVVGKSIDFYNQGSAAAPIIFESYPGETAIFDGAQLAKGTEIYIRVFGKFLQMRRIEVRNMPRYGIWIIGTDNLFEGITAHHNATTGIQITSTMSGNPYDSFPYGAHGSRNVIKNSVVHSNSDAGLFGGAFANGNNSDGIAISSGGDNRVENCLVYGNSDDGIDTWRSTDTYVGYNIIHSNGIADGDGNGIKAGGTAPSADTIVEHNLSFSNRASGIDYNLGRNVQFINNTTWNNRVGYALGSDTVITDNIAAEATKKNGNGIEVNNSWQRSSSVSFISTATNSSSFLVPTSNGGFSDIGAYVNVKTGDSSLRSDLAVTDISYANGIFKATVKNQGSAATPAGVNVRVGYLMDGNSKTWGESVGPLAAGQSIEIGTTGGVYVIPQGTYTIAAYVDNNNAITELNETNNQLSRSIVINTSDSTLLPDVIVTNLSYANGMFKATVKNQGSAATPAGVSVGVGYAVNGQNKTWGSVVGPLAAGQSIEIGTTHVSYVIPNGTHTITAFVDDVNRMLELNETNNKFSQSITVGAVGTGIPDLVVTNLSYANGMFTATVRNQGSAATPAGISVGVGYAVNGQNKTWGSVIGPLATGQSIEIGTTHVSYVIPKGTHTITAFVDDVDRMRESNETNNKFSQSITIP